MFDIAKLLFPAGSGKPVNPNQCMTAFESGMNQCAQTTLKMDMKVILMVLNNQTLPPGADAATMKKQICSQWHNLENCGKNAVANAGCARMQLLSVEATFANMMITTATFCGDTCKYEHSYKNVTLLHRALLTAFLCRRTSVPTLTVVRERHGSARKMKQPLTLKCWTCERKLMSEQILLLANYKGTHSPTQRLCYSVICVSISIVNIYGPNIGKNLMLLLANNKGADQLAHVRSLFSAFVIGILKSTK